MQIDVLLTPSAPKRGQDLMRAVYAGARSRGHDAVLTRSAVREGAILALYGLGGADRIQHANRRGLIAFDCGYWDRKLDNRNRKYRVAFNGFHSPQYVMADVFADRLGGIEVAKSGGNPDGPIMLVGNAPKSNRVGAAGWTAAMSRKIRAAFPGKRILYRPKPRRPVEANVLHDSMSMDRIEDALKGVSLVVCRHSNVAADACRAGVPVVCEDGAASAIYPHCLENASAQPDRELRRRFMERLAWWQWSPEECEFGEFWPWAERWFSEIR
jgi:hypothetical protein